MLAYGRSALEGHFQSGVSDFRRAPAGRRRVGLEFPLSTYMGRIWARAGRTPRKNEKLQNGDKKLQNGYKLVTKKIVKFLTMFIKNLQNFVGVHKKVAFSGKKFVEFDDEVLLDNFSKLWYNGSLAARRPLGRRSIP